MNDRILLLVLLASLVSTAPTVLAFEDEPINITEEELKKILA